MSSVLQNKEWYWKPARSELVDVESKLSLIQIKEGDRAISIINASGKFTCSATWEQLRSKREVQWWKLIWFHDGVLKHGFIG